MKSLNPIFTEPRPHRSTEKIALPAHQTAPPKTKEKRATRSDKCRDIKFPVTPQMRAILIRRADHNKMKETRYCTKLLLRALTYPKSEIPAYPYLEQNTDLTSFMHVKPTAVPYEIILEMRISLGISRREAVYRLIRYAMEKEGMFR